MDIKGKLWLLIGSFFVPKFEYKPLFCGEMVRIIGFSQKNIGYYLLYEHVSNKFYSNSIVCIETLAERVFADK